MRSPQTVKKRLAALPTEYTVVKWGVHTIRVIHEHHNPPTAGYIMVESLCKAKDPVAYVKSCFEEAPCAS